MVSFQTIFLFVLPILALTDAASNTSTNNPNVWNFQIARKVIAAFQFNGMGMAIWEDQGVENTTVVTRRQFYVTPITELLPNSSQCQFNKLTGVYFVSYEVQLWNDRLQLAAVDRLKSMQIMVSPEQVQPLPFYQVRIIWNNAQEKLKKASLSTTWENNLQQQSIRQFKVFTDDQDTCNTLADTLRTQPEFFTTSIALEYSLTAESTATRILTVKTEHLLNSKLMASLKSMDVKSPERYMTADDSNRLTLEVSQNVVASQVVEGEYVPDQDMLALKDIIRDALQFQNVDDGNFTAQLWQSVFWDPIYARPDTVTSYLNKILNINQGNHTISKSKSYSDKGEGGIDFGIDDLGFGAKGSSESSSTATYDEMYEWFRQHNYDIEIKGSIFIPKNRQLTRLNLGVLDRQETIYTKSVQMHHVDAPGLLTVTVGSKSYVESEDIKKLRRDMDAATGRLETRISELEPKVTNALTQDQQLGATIEDVRANLTSALSTKIGECQLCIRGPSGTGETHCTAMSKKPSWLVGSFCNQDGCSLMVQCSP